MQCAWRAEGDTALQSQAAALPFQQVIDLEGITEDCHCLCVAEPVGFTLSQAESAAAQLTANVMLHLRAWRSYQLQVAVDAFPPGLKRNSHRSHSSQSSCSAP